MLIVLIISADSKLSVNLLRKLTKLDYRELIWNPRCNWQELGGPWGKRFCPAYQMKESSTNTTGLDTLLLTRL